MNKTIRVLHCRVGHDPELIEVSESLSSLQKLVQGPVEVVPTKMGFDVWCNEEGRLMDKPLNRRFVDVDPATGRPIRTLTIHGDFFVARSDEDGELQSLPEMITFAVAADRLMPVLNSMCEAPCGEN